MFKIEHPDQDIIDEVFAFLIQCDLADFGEPDTSREDLEQEWGEFDLSQDVWLARDNTGALTGYAYVNDVSEGCHVDVFIDAVKSPAGLEDELATLCITRAAEKTSAGAYPAGPFLIGYATATNKRLQGMYERAGFLRHAFHYRMQIDFTTPVQPVEWPAAYTLHSFQPEDELELYTMIQKAFNWQGHVDAPLDMWRNLVFRGGRFDPQCFILVRQTGELVAAALSYDEDGSGWIRQLAVRQDQQGKGLGSLLLRHMFLLFQQRGAASVALGVAGINENAVQFYERNGMRRRREFIEYRRKLLI